jgi:CRP-like cAMP-binding protein
MTRSRPVMCREDEILDQLTPNLRAEVTHFAHKDTVQLLRRMELFSDLDNNLLNRLIVALSAQFLPPDEVVCSEGELGESLYIIRKGVVSVRSKFHCISSSCSFSNLLCLAVLT